MEQFEHLEETQLSSEAKFDGTLLHIRRDTVRLPDGTDQQMERARGFIPSSVFDNPALLANDPGYLASLASLPEAEKQALLYGSWDSTAMPSGRRCWRSRRASWMRRTKIRWRRRSASCARRPARRRRNGTRWGCFALWARIRRSESRCIWRAG